MTPKSSMFGTECLDFCHRNAPKRTHVTDKKPRPFVGMAFCVAGVQMALRPLSRVQDGNACADARQDLARSPEADRFGQSPEVKPLAHDTLQPEGMKVS